MVGSAMTDWIGRRVKIFYDDAGIGSIKEGVITEDAVWGVSLTTTQNRHYFIPRKQVVRIEWFPDAAAKPIKS